MEVSLAHSAIDRLDLAIERGRDDAMIQKLARDTLDGSMHAHIELLALRHTWRGRWDALALSAPDCLRSLSIAGERPKPGHLNLRLDDIGVWELTDNGTADLACAEQLMNFRDRVARRGHRDFSLLLSAAISELVDNAAEHGRSGFPPVVATQVDARGWSFSVTDLGQGVLKSLKQNPEYANLSNGADALVVAIKDGTSSSGVLDRGQGFSPMFRALADRRAHLRFRSADGGISWTADRVDRHNVPSKVLPPRLGFHVRAKGPLHP